MLGFRQMSYVAPILRTYQHECIESVFREWQTHNSTLVVLPTGSGKSVIFSEIVRRMYPKRSLVIAHRKELIQQAAKHIERAGLNTEIEMANQKADASLFQRASIVVASIQTLVSGGASKRMTKFRPEDFGLIVVDECHHGTASSYKAVLDHFSQNKDIRIFGCTATPDRADEAALGQIFESVAFEYEILDAIEDGYLVPIDQQMVSIGTLDYSDVRTTAGDLNGADLESILVDEKNLQGMVGSAIEIIGKRKSIAFTASVRHAEKCCEIFNRHRAGMAAWISGRTPSGDRARILSGFASGEIQVLSNVGVATEGFDMPDCECVIMGRPTKSRALYTQMCGRVTRPLTGVIDGMHSAYERKEAIASSAKPSALVLDYVGNSGKHKLMTTADILGGKYDDETKVLAEKKVKAANGPVRMTEVFKESERELRELKEKARQAEEARRAKLVATVHFTTTRINPFDAFQIKPAQDKSWDNGKVLSDKQRGILLKMGVDPDSIPYAQGRQLVIEQMRRWQNDLCSLKQIQILRKRGIAAANLTRQEASRLIDEIATKEGWKKRNAMAA
jgi:superfamily II DNA or RNA helicase